jgi:glycyl-tRNA synthetase alpha chain
MYIQNVDNVYDLKFNDQGVTYGDIYHDNEVQFSTYNFEQADTAMLFDIFKKQEAECTRLLAENLPLPAYDCCILASHMFNLLDARGVISVTERAGYIGRVRAMAKGSCEKYYEKREALGFPLLKKEQDAA